MQTCNVDCPGRCSSCVCRGGRCEGEICLPPS
jgi:hypothetical protein